MARWPCRPFGECGRWLSGGTPRTNVPEYWGGEIPWITSGSLTSFLLRDSKRRITVEGVQNGSRLVDRNTILFVVRGMSLKSEFRVGISTRAMAFGQDCKAVVPSVDIEPYFLANVLRASSLDVLGMVEYAAHGTGRLDTGRLKALPIPVPPLSTQRTIAALMVAFDRLIENNLRRIEILEEVAEAVYREWFVNFRYPGHEDIPFGESRIGPIPDGWKLSDLGASARWLSGGTPKTSEPSYWGGDVPWITSGSLTTFLLDRSDRTLTKEGVQAGSRVVPRDSLLFVVRGMSLATEFRHGIAEVPLAFGQDCKALIAESPVDPLYLAYSVSTRASEIQGMVEYAAHGTGKLPTDRLKALPVLHPPDDVQKAFVRVVAPMRNLMSNLRGQLDSLRSTRDLLLPRLVSGEIDVSQWEIDTKWLVS